MSVTEKHKPAELLYSHTHRLTPALCLHLTHTHTHTHTHTCANATVKIDILKRQQPSENH